MCVSVSAVLIPSFSFKDINELWKYNWTNLSVEKNCRVKIKLYSNVESRQVRRHIKATDQINVCLK